MYGTIAVTDFSASWYFISFVVIVTLFFNNLFVGLILSSQADEQEREDSYLVSVDDSETHTEMMERLDQTAVETVAEDLDKIQDAIEEEDDADMGFIQG
jgi:hypothetical protein